MSRVLRSDAMALRGVAAGSEVAGSSTERAPEPPLRGVVRTVWVQRTGDTAVVHTHLPTGGTELHVVVGGAPRLLGPLTGPLVEVLPPRSTVLGVRFLPGSALRVPGGAAALLDRRVELAALRPDLAARLVEAVASASDPDAALTPLQHVLVGEIDAGDPLVRTAVRLLMPWRTTSVADVADRVDLSPSQLRRRLLQVLGLTPKTLHRTLRLQGFLALAQAAAAGLRLPGPAGLSRLATEAGYADQAHLTRECVRLTGQTPRTLLHGASDHCACGHDRAASYRPFLLLGGRPVPVAAPVPPAAEVSGP